MKLQKGNSNSDKKLTFKQKDRLKEKAAAGSKFEKYSKNEKSSRSSKDERPARFSKDEKPARFSKDGKTARFNKDERPARFSRDEKVTREIKPTREVKAEFVEEKEIREDLIEGRNAVIEALRSDRTIESIMVAKGDLEGSISVVLGLAKEKKIVVKEVDRRKLDQLSETGSHQGVIAIVTPFVYCEIEDIIRYAKEKGEEPFIIVLDEIEDPHNFGSIIRTAEVCGAHGVIIPKRRNVGVTPVVYKSAAGAVEHMKIAKVTNINAAIEKLKTNNIWTYAADMDGKTYSYNVNFKGAVALVIGSEGRGISKLTKDKCDMLVRIPMVGQISSLNASVAAGIMMYEVLKQKKV